MAVPSTIADLDATAANNSPSGSESIGTNLDDYLRAHAAIIKQVSNSKVSKDSDVGAASMPVGTTGQRPSASTGLFRFNTTLSQFEGYNGSAWGAVGGGATGGVGNAAFYENDVTVTADYTITTNKNAMTAGPITINSGVTVTVPSGSVWTVV